MAKWTKEHRGEHGYDPAEPDMDALFLAHGPAFSPGVTLAPFDNVDVYPLLAKISGRRAGKNDRHLADLAAGPPLAGRATPRAGLFCRSNG